MHTGPELKKLRSAISSTRDMEVAHCMGEEEEVPPSVGLFLEGQDVNPVQVDVAVSAQSYAFLEDFHSALLRQ